MNSNQLTLDEKRIIFHILILIMNADNQVLPQETTFLDNIFKEFGLDIDEFDHVELMDIDYLTRLFRTLSKDKQAYAVSLFNGMAACDGFVDPRETKVIKHICKGE